MPERSFSRLTRALVFGAALGVLVLTLFPTGHLGSPGLFDCLICGERGFADAILNVLLFLPLGAAIALLRTRMDRAILACAMLSASIELAQFFIPGRDASLGDLLFNSIGAMAGVLVTRSAAHWIAPSPVVSARISVAAALVVVSLWGLTGWLLQPMIPANTAFPIWHPDLAQYEQWSGEVTGVALDRDVLPDREPVSGARLRQSLTSGATIRIAARGGVPRTVLTPMLAIFDTKRHEIFVVGPIRDDLGVRFRLRAAGYFLDRPTIRGRGLMADQAPGTPLEVVVRLNGGRACLGVGDRMSCGYGHTLGSGRALLLSLPHVPAPLIGVLQVVWMAMLAAPVGFWLRRRPESLVSLLLLAAGVIVVPRATGLLPTPALELLGVTTGLLLGIALSALANGRPVSRPVAGTGARTAASSLRR